MSEDTIRELPPSAKLVLKVLEYNGGLTQKEIVECSRLSQRTVREALTRLVDADIVEKEIYIPDARQDLYRLTAEEADTERPEATID